MHQAITWANVNPDPCPHMASLGHNELKIIFYWFRCGPGMGQMKSYLSLLTCAEKLSYHKIITHKHFKTPIASPYSFGEALIELSLTTGFSYHQQLINWFNSLFMLTTFHHQRKTFFNPLTGGGFPTQRASNADVIFMSWHHQAEI